MSVQVQTRLGAVEGERRDAHVTFRGIPFAKPPVGALRFRRPEPLEPWRSVRPAHEFGPAAMQGASAIAGMGIDGPMSEDCLYLNIDTPAADGAKRPVMFWIHGGAFTLGSSSAPIYDGARLAERGDVVVVTTNYRLGAFGYLSLEQHGAERLGATANAGQLDQIAALRWVRDNIAVFGGDPDNVTIFGESAGSIAVCMLLVMPEARGLFKRAIAQSGSMVELADTQIAAKTTDGLLADLKLDASNIERLWDVPAERMIEAQRAAAEFARDGRSFFPVMDGKTIPRQPGELVAAGEAANVPLIIGTNRDEMNLFVAPLLRKLDEPMSDEQACGILAHEVKPAGHDRLPGLLAAYRKSRIARGLPSSTRALLCAIQGDSRFRVPSLRYVESYRKFQPKTYMYMFCHESPAMRGVLRACHALEIPFVFGTLDKPFQDKFAGTGQAVQQLSATMMDIWLSFARNGEPRFAASDWIPYDAQRRATMIFDAKSGLVDAPFDEERVAWDGIA